MKHVMAVITLCSLVVPGFVLVDSDAWSGCTIEQRIELGNQGYDKGEVEKACRDTGDVFLDILSKGVEIGLNKLGGSGNNHYTDASSTTNGVCFLRISSTRVLSSDT
jgi:hypothetical protein